MTGKLTIEIDVPGRGTVAWEPMSIKSAIAQGRIEDIARGHGSHQNASGKVVWTRGKS